MCAHWAIAIFTNHRDCQIKSPISGMSDISNLNRHSSSVPLPRFSMFAAANRQ